MGARPIPLTSPRAAISEATIVALVHAFYGRILQDEALGPIFRDRLARRWDEHLAVMADFWSSVALSSGRYAGKPHAAHQDLELSPEHFARWLALFERTARETCGDSADFFIDRAGRIAESLMIGLGIGPKALKWPPAAEAQP